MKLIFPYDTQRPIQKEMMNDVAMCINSGKHLIAHAPTGLGKTAAVLSPSLDYALDNGKTVIFLTPKHTQHQIVIETLKKVKEKNKVNINAVDFIGKKWMCLVPGVQMMTSGDFAEFCKETKKDEHCTFYNNIYKKNELTHEAENLIKKIEEKSPLHVEEVCRLCSEKQICPHEMSCQLAKNANVLIADYYHIFHPHIRNAFLVKTNKRIENCIIIVDEAQNLPSRIREVLSSTLSNFSLERAIKEARKSGMVDTANQIVEIYNILIDFSKQLVDKKEMLVLREEFINKVQEVLGRDFEEIAGDFLLIGEKIRLENKKSFVGNVGSFMQNWLAEGEFYTRIIRQREWRGKKIIQLNCRCLDPAVSSREIFEECYSAVLMSGTLTPTKMYRDLLGMDKERTICKEYDNPFPKSNRLSLIVPDTTTKYTRRKPEEYKKIARWCAEISNEIPGNVAVFFPSYSIRNEVMKEFQKKSKKSIFCEQAEMNKIEKLEMLNQFKEYADLGAVFLGVTGGSFGEGVNLPGKFLKAVIIVGVPLDSPDLETQSLINYYEKLFGAGWDYGYIFPAMNRVIQAAGRVIRSETDYGVVVLLDERFTWKNYFKCLPIDWKIIVTKSPVEKIKNFFSEKNRLNIF